MMTSGGTMKQEIKLRIMTICESSNSSRSKTYWIHQFELFSGIQETKLPMLLFQSELIQHQRHHLNRISESGQTSSDLSQVLSEYCKKN
jgi:hypothetical protein